MTTGTGAGARRLGRALVARGTFLGLLGIIGVTGLILALYHRPWGAHFWSGTHVGRVGLHLEVTNALGWLHAIAGHVGVLLLVALAFAVWRGGGPARSEIPGGDTPRGRISKSCVLVALVFAVLAVVSGHAVAWQDTLPWSDRTRLQVASLDETEGPFPELVGVAARYASDGRDSRRAVTATAIFHAITPILGVGIILGCLRRRRLGRDT